MKNSYPVLGVFPRFYGMGESYPLVKVAENYINLGGEVIFFTHGGEYDRQVRDLGCKVISVEPMIKNTTQFFKNHSDREIIEIIQKEAEIYKKSNIDALVQTNVFFGCILAARLAKIPLISLISGTFIPPYAYQNKTIYLDVLDIMPTRYLPKFIKIGIYKLTLLLYKGPVTKKFNRISKKLGLKIRFRNKLELIKGDYTIVCDNLDFLGIKPTRDFPRENFVGPIIPQMKLSKEEEKLDSDIEKFLQKPGKKILLSFGSSTQWKKTFLKIIKTLDNTEYNVIALYTTILTEDELPDVGDNIIFKKFVKNIYGLSSRVDLKIIHGGRGTVYNSIYNGKPIIGYPLHFEQEGNLDNLRRFGSAIKLSRVNFSQDSLLKSIKIIFDNYDEYHSNAKKLANLFPPPAGDKQAVKRILEILKS